MNRLEFVKGLTASMTISAFPSFGSGSDDMIWACFLPFGRNMWSDVPVPRWGRNDGSTEEKRRRLLEVCAADHVRFDVDSFRRIAGRMREAGANTVVIDLGEALQYPSHPELSVKGSWAPERFRNELAWLREIGLEPIPKLNFSTSHDLWLKEYHRMVSTRKYYEVCRDVINDVCEIFDRPRFFHLGYDEESAELQRYYGYCVVRQGELWWHDFLYISGLVEKQGVRPWIWSDFCWHHPEDFVRRMPKSVLQSNWYYGASFDYENPKMSQYASRAVRTYLTLEKAGFDQVPCGSDHLTDVNMPETVRFCKERLSRERLKGFFLAPWYNGCLPAKEKMFFKAANCLLEAKKVFSGRNET